MIKSIVAIHFFLFDYAFSLQIELMDVKIDLIRDIVYSEKIGVGFTLKLVNFTSLITKKLQITHYIKCEILK